MITWYNTSANYRKIVAKEAYKKLEVCNKLYDSCIGNTQISLMSNPDLDLTCALLREECYKDKLPDSLLTHKNVG